MDLAEIGLPILSMTNLATRERMLVLRIFLRSTKSL